MSPPDRPPLRRSQFRQGGNLLVACAPEAADAVLARFRVESCDRATVIEQITAGAPHATVR